MEEALKRSGSPFCSVALPIYSGGRTVFLKTYGCAHNKSDSEALAGVLERAGYSLVDSEREADLVVINSCTVKGPSEESFLHNVRRLRSQGRPLVVAGCVPQAAPGHLALKGVSQIGTAHLSRIAEAAERTLSGEEVRFLGRGSPASLALPRRRSNPFIEILPVSEGCLSACAYCKTKHARGPLRSHRPGEIEERVRSAIAQGAQQVWLTSEDLGAYGRDIGVSLPELLWRIVRLLPDGVMLRLGMTNPPYIIEHKEEIARILAHERVFAFIHLPVQSGSDAILAKMRRGYAVSQFEDLVRFLREKVPSLTVATDIICGFPGESEEDFNSTLALVRRHAFPILNISKFYARPGTAAARMRPIDSSIVKERTRIVTQAFKRQRPYGGLRGKTVPAWFSGVKDGKLRGHTKGYVEALAPLDEKLLGRRAMVRIEKTAKHHVRCVPTRG